MTYNQYVPPAPRSGRKGIRADIYRSDFVEIMEMMDKRLNDKGKNWRHVFKVGLCFFPLTCLAVLKLIVSGIDTA